MIPGLLGAVVDLNRTPYIVHWGWLQITLGNLVVIALMVVVFVVALLAPFPGRSRR